MFKKLQYFFLLLTLTSISQSNLIQSQTFCLVDCHECFGGPYKCTILQSLLFEGSNRNCIPYTVGKSCDAQPEGFQMIGKGLEDWKGVNHTINPPIECQINNQPAETPKFKSIGPFNQKPIYKTFNFERNTLEAIIVKMSFTIKSPNLTIEEYNSSTNKKQTVSPSPSSQSDQPAINPDGTIDTITEDRTVQQSSKARQSNQTKKIIFNLLVTGPNISYKIQLNTPSKYFPGQKIISTSCGIHVKYVSSHKFPKPVKLLNKTQLKFEIIPQQMLAGQWGLVKFEVSIGCGGLIVNGGNGTCSTCATGYYPIMGHENILMSCAPCHPSCKACTNKRCTLCQQITQFHKDKTQCIFKKNFRPVTNIKYQKGEILENNPKNQYFFNTLKSESNTVTFRGQLFSPSPYGLKFLFIYSRQFILSLKKRPVNIFMNDQIILKIQADQFKQEIGMYDERFQMGNNFKYYVKTMYINRFQQQNYNKILTISIKAPQDSKVFYISNLYLIQYQCIDKCAQCNRVSNECLRCSSFFVQKGNIACSVCPNGFYLDKKPVNTIVEVFQNYEEVCIKCHSTCKQCIGPGLHQCTSCYKLFSLTSPQYNRSCIRCVYQAKMNINLEECALCLKKFSYETIFQGQNCLECIKNRNIDDLTSGQVCTNCWIQNGLASGRCKQTKESSLSFYGSDLNEDVIEENKDSVWQVVGSQKVKLKMINCSREYQNLWGIQSQDQDKSESKNISIKWTQNNLPTHRGFYIIFNIIKRDLKLLDSGNDKKGQKIYINIGQQISHVIDFSIKRSGSTIVPGWNLCGGSQNQMISTFSFDSPQHIADNLNVLITAEGGNIFLRQLELYLGNCPQCKNQLNYQIKHMPTYYFNITFSILNIWIVFNKPILNSNKIDKAFKFSIDKIGEIDLNSVNFTNQLQTNNRLKYQIPIQKSFEGGMIHVISNPDVKIYGNLSSLATKRLLINSQLNKIQSQQTIQRISHLNPDQNISSSQVYSFYNFFQWFALIVMIILVGLGLGVVFEEFSILLQLLFLHTYITSNLLPGTFKSTILGLSRMENLNYFSEQHASSLQFQWFKDYIHPSPVIFQQFNTDILFLRSYYPIIIINIIYVIVFFILLAALKFSQTLKLSNNPLISIFRQIPARPINYFDQIWRYQFITTIWSAVMQFHIIKKDTPLQNINLAICFISFIISLIWPIAIVLYTYYRNKYKRATDFVYTYEDIFFLKFETVSEMKPKYYYYIFIRFARYLIITIFINIFIQYEIIAPIILIAVNLVEIVYVYALDIYYQNKLGSVFKILENLLFIGVEVMYLAAYAMVDVSTESEFHNLGSAMNVLYVFMIILGMLRVLYIGYRKFESIKMNARVNIDTGQQFKDHQVKVPDTERNDEAINNQL